MNTSTILCEDYYVPEKPQPKIAWTAEPDEPLEETRENPTLWATYIKKELEKIKRQTGN